MKKIAAGKILLTLLPLLIALPVRAQPSTSAAQMPVTPATPAAPAKAQDPLFQRIEALDAAMFDAFNTCELKKLESFFVPTVEFYHDKDGLSLGREKFMAAVKKNVCGKFRRELVPGTLEVFPIGTYGAMQMGSHLFCQTKATRCEGFGRFMSIWQNKDGQWKLTRLVSYDHRPAP